MRIGDDRIGLTEIAVVGEICSELAEGPIWDPRTQQLFWVDILAGCVHRYDPASRGESTYNVGQPVGAAALEVDGSLILAVREGFSNLNLASGQVRPIATLGPEAADCRMNDGACDAAGRFWAGTMAFDERPGAGALYRLEPSGKVDQVISHVTVSNGIDWNPRNDRMYFVDSATRRVDILEFDLRTGTASNRRPFITFRAADGVPDGLTVDADGCVWVALWDGGAIRRYSPEGEHINTVCLPVQRPTSCVFGGADLEDLYISSAWAGLSAEARRGQPLAGRVFRCRPGITGRPPNVFGA